MALNGFFFSHDFSFAFQGKTIEISDFNKRPLDLAIYLPSINNSMNKNIRNVVNDGFENESEHDERRKLIFS